MLRSPYAGAYCVRRRDNHVRPGLLDFATDGRVEGRRASSRRASPRQVGVFRVGEAAPCRFIGRLGIGGDQRRRFGPAGAGVVADGRGDDAAVLNDQVERRAALDARFAQHVPRDDQPGRVTHLAKCAVHRCPPVLNFVCTMLPQQARGR